MHAASQRSHQFIGLGLLIALFLGTQAHLGLLQIGAWTSMIAQRAPEAGIEDAVESTFSGEAPCPLCRAVEAQAKAPVPSPQDGDASRHDERETESVPPLKALCQAIKKTCFPQARVQSPPVRPDTRPTTFIADVDCPPPEARL